MLSVCCCDNNFVFVKYFFIIYGYGRGIVKNKLIIVYRYCDDKDKKNTEKLRLILVFISNLIGSSHFYGFI
jgi:hypothetical protein